MRFCSLGLAQNASCDQGDLVRDENVSWSSRPAIKVSTSHPYRTLPTHTYTMKAHPAHGGKHKSLIGSCRTVFFDPPVQMALKILGVALMAMAYSSGIVIAQEKKEGPLPETPTAFETRNLNKTSETLPTIQKVGGKLKRVTVIAVTKSRKWKDNTGKAIMGRLLAFEPIKNQEPLLIRDGKIRLLVDGAKSYNIFPLSKLGAEDQAYIKGLVAARKKQTKARR